MLPATFNEENKNYNDLSESDDEDLRTETFNEENKNYNDLSASDDEENRTYNNFSQTANKDRTTITVNKENKASVCGQCCQRCSEKMGNNAISGIKMSLQNNFLCSYNM